MLRLGGGPSRLERAHRAAFADPVVVNAYGNWSGLSFSEVAAIESCVTPEVRVLDIGAGTGRIAKTVAPKCGSYLGVELSEPMLRVAKAANIENAEFVLGDILSVELPMNQFDVVLCMHNTVDELHPYKRRRHLFRRILTWLTPDGFLIFSSHVLHAGSALGGRVARQLARTRGWRYVPESYHGRTVWQYRSVPDTERANLERWGFSIDRQWPDASREPPDWMYYRAHRSVGLNMATLNRNGAEP
jgi:SAM-dependent methyltransferase